MNETDSDKSLSTETDASTLPATGGWIDRWLRQRIIDSLAALQGGRVTLQEGDQAQTLGDDDPQALQATIEVIDPAFYRQVALGGSVGAGEAYMAGHWRCTELTTLIRILARNRALLDRLEGGTAWVSSLANKGLHWLNRNSSKGSRKNIAAHYDLGNDLFERMLDQTMMYSCAFFEHSYDSLQQASLNKLDRICRKLELSPDDHVIEIGAGWGGFAIHAARHYGCRVTTTTISQEQYDFAQQRIRAAGLGDRVELLFEDYRKLEGQYDKLVSIEMIEAVGHQYLDTYLKQCSDLLKADGSMLLQAITIEDQRYAHAIKEADFIKRYIFPGSFIPSVAAINQSLARVSDLRLTDLEDIGLHYAQTLRLWREQFFAHQGALEARGYDATFQRMWEFYLCYCEGGFLERSISDVQMLLTKPRCRNWQSLAGVIPQ
ncbi:cyclopropane-fatty-acyl-phospholipid synthase [Methylohalomonas lacus]|uniref:Cyclopropane-fatty-acyl-phospholipid synthase n=1 Tax=Methylohalomonas lacus TaxID=398773 RepID=A0AAE3HK32_9GAMM|nr:cyclopropane-fatty-acyl-phospholipid synthase family protein [Methylohalomonas lacus]MCS3902347.1 cyclopropane-fatty-acyl-phospholipid synthase [Methylohalomonas lacus]